MEDLPYLSGGEQTTINSTITELFPALAFNSGVHPRTADELEEFIKGVDLSSNGASKSFVNSSNIESAKEELQLNEQYIKLKEDKAYMESGLKELRKFNNAKIQMAVALLNERGRRIISGEQNFA